MLPSATDVSKDKDLLGNDFISAEDQENKQMYAYLPLSHAYKKNTKDESEAQSRFK